MSDLIVRKLNDVYFQIECELDKRIELYNYLKCHPEGYLWSPRYKLHVWDGYVSFFDTRNSTLPIGLYPLLQKFCIEYKYKYSFEFSSEEFRNNFTDEYLKNFYEEIFSGTKIRPRDYQHELIKAAINKKRGILVSATACHQKGTKILMMDGTFKKVEDVIVGDRLMGPDGTVRNVLKLANGADNLFKIIPIRGKEFVVNGEHVLHLQFTTGARKRSGFKDNISVNDYLTKDKWYKHLTKLVYNDVELKFENLVKNETKLNAYFVGVYLGDGCIYGCGVTTMDSEIVDEIKKQIKVYGLNESNIRVVNNGSKASTYYIRTDKIKNSGLGRNRNPIVNDFRKIGLNFTNNKERTKCGLKFIPDVFKYGSIEERYEILAGLIDTDGHLANNSFYEIVSKSETLVDDICFVARSLGFVTSKTIKHNKKYDRDYFKCTIQGNIQKIPVRIARKKIIFDFESRQKQHNLSGFKVEEYGVGEYFGFTLDGDSLYMLDDFLVTHNSGKSLVIYALIRFFLQERKRVLLIVPSIQLVEQMYTEFNKEYGWSLLDNYVTKMHNKVIPDFKKPVLISTFQSLAKKDREFFEKYGAMIVDETHQAKNLSIKTVAMNCVNASYRIGVTGTMTKDLCSFYTITGYLGPILKEVKTKQLQDEGYLAQLRIKNIILKYSREFIKENCRLEYQDEKKVVYQNPDRNKVLNLIFSKIPDGQNSLILVENLWHIELVKKHIEEKFDNKYQLFIITGEIDPTVRETLRQLMETERNVILLATFGSFSVGVSVKNIENLVLFSSSRGEIRILQSIGRGLRLKDGKTHVTLWDVVDSLCYKTKSGNDVKNHLFMHWEGDPRQDKEGRIDYYTSQKFEFKTLEKKVDELV